MTSEEQVDLIYDFFVNCGFAGNEFVWLIQWQARNIGCAETVNALREALERHRAGKNTDKFDAESFRLKKARATR